MDDARRHAPAAARNRDAILAVLRRCLPPRGLVLEVASGSGEHALHFAAALPALRFQPTDADVAARASIDAWRRQSGLDNLLPPLLLDASADDWPVPQADAVLCINMIHIAPWAACQGLFRGAARLLPPGAPLLLYGPFMREGRHTAPSNAAFDLSLRQQDSGWGVRGLEQVADLAGGCGFTPPEVVAMPANNLTLVFRRGRTPA